MFQPDPSLSKTRLMRCGCGTYDMTIGPVTLHLLEEELLLMVRTTWKMAERSPALRAKLIAQLYSDSAGEDLNASPGLS